MCKHIESERPKNLDTLYLITHAATEQLNDLQDEFEENESKIETVVREYLAETMYLNC